MPHAISHDRLPRHARIGLATFGLLVAAPALAADLAYPYPPEPAPSRVYREERIEEQALPPPPPRTGPGFDGPHFAAGPHVGPHVAPPPPAEVCRTIVKRRIDPYGEEVVRRERICEEASGPPPRPRPSFYDPGPPVPPASVPYEEPDGPPRY